MKQLIGKFIIEFFGTFLLTLVVALTGHPLSIGAVLVALVFLGGQVSGGHYNPAVSLAAMLRGALSVRELFAYVFAQVLGAVAACAFFFVVSGDSFLISRGQGVGNIQIGLVEGMFTFSLCLTVLMVATFPKLAGNQFYGLAIGMVLLAAVLAGGDISGGVYNPAIVIGSVVSQRGSIPTNLFEPTLYLWPQLLGAVAAALVYKIVAWSSDQS